MEKNSLFLIFVNELGVDWEGNNKYEFLFSNTLENIDGENWDNYPAAGYPEPPNEEIVKETAMLSSSLKFELLQNSTSFSMWDAIDGVVSIAWEDLSDYIVYPDKRISFKYGDTLDNVEKILYQKDIRLLIKSQNEIKE